MFYAIAAIIIVLICYVIWQRAELNKFETTQYDVSMTEASDKSNYDVDKSHMNKSDDDSGSKDCVTQFVVIADLHNHIYGNDNEKLICEIDKIKPDFIVIAGDIMIAKPGYDLDVTVKLVEVLSKKYKIYYGMGNHEYRLKLYKDTYPGMYDRFVNMLARCNVSLLDNKSEIIKVNGRRIVITGLEIERKYYKRLKKIHMSTEYVDKLVGRKKEDFTILIAHNPEYFETYVKWGADLILSGHIHGGMVRLPFLGGVISPKVQFFPKYSAGKYTKDGKTMILSRGLGMHTIPVRINNRAELVHIKLLDLSGEERWQYL